MAPHTIPIQNAVVEKIEKRLKAELWIMNATFVFVALLICFVVVGMGGDLK